MKVPFRLVIGLSTGCACFGLGSVADAALYSFPGIACMDGDGNGQYSAGIAYNPSSVDDAPFLCPIQRRDPDNANITGIVVMAIDQNNDGSGFGHDVQCVARSCAPDGTSCSASSVVYSAGSSGAAQAVPSVGSLSVAGYTNGMAWVACSIPNNDPDGGLSGLVTYRWDD